MRNIFKNVLLIFLSFSFLGFTGKEKFVQLDGAMNARGSAQFLQSSHNVLFTLKKDTKAEILRHKRFASGNYGLQVRVASGPHANKVIWVYYNSSRPTLALFEKCPASWAQSSIPSCGPANSPERANASVALAPTPATRNEPQEIPTLATVTVTPTADELASARKTETIAQPPCTNCSAPTDVAAAPSQSFVDQLVESTSKNALTGAYRVMANLYQSCHVLNLPPIHLGRDDQMSRYISKRGRARVLSQQNLERAANSHYYLRNAPEPRNPSCRDMKKTPPLYFFGGKPSMKNGALDIFAKAPTRGGVQTVGLDCSGFVSGAFSVSGLKLTPNARNASVNFASSSMLHSYTERNSCFNRPSFNRDQTIQSGDVVAWRGHTYMIDKVGADPFGVKKAIANNRITSASQCGRFQPAKADLDFTIIQSTGAGNLPAMRIEAKNYGGSSVRSYVNMAIQACRAQFSNNTGSDFVALPNRSSAVSLLRHKGDSDPRCSFSKEQTPRLAGEECTQGCFRETL